MSGWNYADIWDHVAAVVPEAPALIHGDQVRTWGEMNRRANALARTLLDRGCGHQDKVAQYLYNCSEYMESMFGCFKAGLVPVNTNYRYADDELVYLWDNSDSVAVVFHGTFSEMIGRIRSRVQKVHTWLWVDDGSGLCPDWAIDYEVAASAPTEGDVRPPQGRSGEDIFMLYTGGTTGLPKGVMWRQDDQIRAVVGRLAPNLLASADFDPLVVEANVSSPGVVGLPACPLMHGTGMFTAQSVLCGGGSLVTLTKRRFDVEELLDAVTQRRVNAMAIVGDAFAKPIVAAIEANPGRWDLSSLLGITSSGVMWSHEIKARMLAIHPGMVLMDAFSSSEALGMGVSTTTADNIGRTARFDVGEEAIVVADDGSRVEPGSGAIGRVAVSGFQPVGYYKDQAKSAATFLIIDGRRYSVPGDYATVNADGSLTLLGRGSVCINTGGEKVFPEEVEEALKLNSSVADAVAVGVPDDKFGEAVTALVQAEEGEVIDEAELISFVKTRLASYKAPKRIFVIETIGRAANGKVDYRRLRQVAEEKTKV